MKHTYFILMGLIIMNFSSQAQDPTFDWVLPVGSTGADIMYSTKILNTGEIVVAGRFEGTVDFDPEYNFYPLVSAPGGASDIFVAKYNPNGSLQWVTVMGGSGTDYANSVVVNSGGEIFVAGRFQNTVNFGPGPGQQTLTAGSDDYFVFKLDGGGQLIWVINSGGTNEEIATDIALDNSGNVFVSGYFTGAFDFDPGVGTQNITSNGSRDIFVMKLDLGGGFLWAKTTGSSTFDYGSSVAIDNSGNVFVGGRFGGTMDLDPGAGVNMVTPTGSDDLFILKLDNSGTYIWGYTLGGSSVDYVTDIAIDGNDDVIMTGYFAGSVDFDPGVGTDMIMGAATQNIFIWKLSSAGVHQWALPFSNSLNSQGAAVAINSLNDIYLTGQFNGVMDFYPGVGTFNCSSFGASDNFLLHLDQNGSFIGVQFMGTSSADAPRGLDVQLFGNSDVIALCGNFTGNGDYDPTSGSSTIGSAGGFDAYLVKLELCLPVSITPDVSSLPDITDECQGNPSTFPSATSDCGGIYYGDPDVSFPITTQGTTVVTWTFDAGNGITTTQQQNVIVSDVTAPVPDISSLIDLTDECSVSMPVAPTATDNCVGASITGTPDVPFPITSQGTTVVTWTYTDGINSSTQQQNVIISDITAPVPDSSTLSDYSEECVVGSVIAPTATDNCSGTITGTPDVSFPITTAGTTIITWTFDDGNGNTSTQTQNIIVTDIDTSVTQNGLTLTSNSNVTNTFQWVDCNNGYSAITGETSQVFTVTTNGSYAVIINSGSCTDTSACYVMDGVGWESNEDLNIFLYPNPSEGKFYASISGINTTYNLSIFTINGAEVYRQSNLKNGQNLIDLFLVPGVYFVQLYAENTTTHRIKLIIQ